MFFLFVLASLFGSLVLQHFLGPLPPWGARFFLMPVVFLYGALSFSGPRMLGMAVLCGGMWDLLHLQGMEDSGDLGVGWSMIAYGILGMLISGLRPLFLRGRWEVHCLFSGVATSVLVLLEYLMLSLRREPLRFDFSAVVWGRIFGAGVLALLVSPVVFWGMGYVSRLLRHKPYRPRRSTGF
jgi:hypothetical protein